MQFAEQFKDVFEPELLAAIEENGKQILLRADEVLLETGQTVRAFPIVLSGLLKVSRPDEEGKDLLLYYIPAVCNNIPAK
jgi:CRP/FNR family transcriptional regulator